MKRLISLALMAMLSGCSQEVPNVPETSTPVATVAAAPVAGEGGNADKIPAGGMTVALGQADCSDGVPVAMASIEWDAGELAPAGIAIHVESPGNPRKLWLEGRAKGRESTGKWVFAGSRFTLFDKASGQQLAQRAVGDIPCPKP